MQPGESGVTDSTRTDRPRIYKDDGDRLLKADTYPDRVILLPAGDPEEADIGKGRIRIQWGQHILKDVLSGHYRTVVCGVNDEDNTHGIIGRLLDLVTTSQWTVNSATSYAKEFQSSIALHNQEDREPYILKFDLDSILILGILRPKDRSHFTLRDLGRGFKTISKMLASRHDRLPVASVSFLGAKSNQLLDDDGREPAFEEILETMFESEFRGDVYPSIGMWELAPTGTFANYPFPEGLEQMRSGGY